MIIQRDRLRAFQAKSHREMSEKRKKFHFLVWRHADNFAIHIDW